MTVSPTKGMTEENVFTINNVRVEGAIDLNFSRNKYLNKAFLKSYEMLMSRILITRDLQKVNKTELKGVKNLINSFQILEESYSKNMYSANIKVFYNEKKIKKFLSKKNISFSRPDNISVVFYPILFVNGEIQDFEENFFYTQWMDIEVKNELINFILPLEDLEDISKITKMKNKIEEINIDSLVSKYDIKNYVFILTDYQDERMSIYLKTNFNNNKITKNISYELKNIKDEIKLRSILKDLKLNITDLWKEENLVNILSALSIKIKFQHKNLKDLDELRDILYKINIIDNYTLEEFNINNSSFKIYYYTNPKKLKSELLKFGYLLRNEQGSWQIYLNE